MSILKKSAANQWIAGVARIAAAEMDSLGRLLELLAQPSLVSLATPINTGLCAPTISGTQVQLGAIGANDRVITAGAACPAYHRNTVDFATAGDDGGPLAAGDYTIYFDVYEPDDPGTPTPVPYQCYPIAVPTSDPDAPALAGPIYLVPATVHWDGASTLSALVDRRAGNWGPLRLDRLGAGNSDRVLIGSGRLVEFEGQAQVDDVLQVGSPGAEQGTLKVGGGSQYGIATIGDNAAGGKLALQGPATGANVFQIFSSAIDWLIYGAIDLSNYVTSRLAITVGKLLDVVFAAGSTITLQGASGGDGAAIMTVAGGAAINLSTDAKLNIDHLSDVGWAYGEPPASPAANKLYAASLARAWAIYYPGATPVAKTHNCSVACNSTGYWTVTLAHGFADTKFAAIATPAPVGTESYPAPYWVSAQPTSGTTIDVRINGIEFSDGALTTPSVDVPFSLAVYGGNQS